MQYEGQQNTVSDQSVVQSGHDGGVGGSLSQLLSRSTPTPQHSMANAINSIANAGRGSVMNPLVSQGLGAVKSPLSINNMSPSHTVTMNKASTVTSTHLSGAGDGLPGMTFSMATSTAGSPIVGMTNTINMKPMGSNPGQLMGGVPGMNMAQQNAAHHNQMMNGPSFPPVSMGQVRGLAPTTISSANPLTMAQNNIIGNSMPQMPGHQNMGHMGMNVPQQQPQIARVSDLYCNFQSKMCKK